MGLRTSVKNMLLGNLMGKYFVANASRRNHTLMLTFDDGPDPIYTPKVLDLLRAHGASATFFMIGEKAERHPEIVRRILDEGHEIGNHAYRHVKFAALPLQDQLCEIALTDSVLSQHDGRQSHWFRPPQGRLSLRLLFALLQIRHRIAMWSYDSLDYQTNGVAPILSRFRSKPVRNGEVILFHDDNDFTVSALQHLLIQWRVQGYEFGLISRRAESSPNVDVG